MGGHAYPSAPGDCWPAANAYTYVHVYAAQMTVCTSSSAGVTLSSGTAAVRRPLSDPGIATVTEQVTAADIPV